jgi:hypothetical protein
MRPRASGEQAGMWVMPSCESARPTRVGFDLSSLPQALGVWK